MPEFFNISCFAGGNDNNLFREVINKGIDSHLEAFTRSNFKYVNHRLIMDFHNSELHILIRRLRELGNEDADLWADDIQYQLNKMNESKEIINNEE